MIVAIFQPGASKTANATGLNQYDYGQVLRIQGLQLQTAAEIHFSKDEHNGDSVTRFGVTKDGVTDVVIPDSMLATPGNIYAWVYVRDDNSGETQYKMMLTLKSRPKPEMYNPEDHGMFEEVVKAVNEAADRADDAADRSESAEDNAKYYAGQARDAAAGVPGAVEQGKKDIDEYTTKKEAELKGDTGNVYFAAFKVVSGRLKMYSDPDVDKVRFVRHGSRLAYRLAM